MPRASTIAHKLDANKWRSDDVKLSAEDEGIHFSALMLSDALLDGLRKSGFIKPSPIQLRAIPLGRCGVDLIIQAKSGTGKTCVFAVIALDSIDTNLPRTQALILAPTREIAVQICEVIVSVGSAFPKLKCYAFIGGIPLADDKEKLKKCHIVVGTPGRIKHLIQVKMLNPKNIRLLVLDEADVLFSEVHRDVVKWIYATLPTSKQFIAASATYSDDVAAILKSNMRNAALIQLNKEQPALLGITQYYLKTADHILPHVGLQYKVEALLKLLSSISFSQCLIFLNSQSRAQSVCESLRKVDWPVEHISGNHEQLERLRTMARFKKYASRILVATDLIARGIDLENVNLVINVDVPWTIETYLHRIGRAGRYGSRGLSITLVASDKDQRSLAFIKESCHLDLYELPDPIPLDIWERHHHGFGNVTEEINSEQSEEENSKLSSDEAGNPNTVHSDVSENVESCNKFNLCDDELVKNRDSDDDGSTRSAGSNNAKCNESSLGNLIGLSTSIDDRKSLSEKLVDHQSLTAEENSDSFVELNNCSSNNENGNVTKLLLDSSVAVTEANLGTSAHGSSALDIADGKTAISSNVSDNQDDNYCVIDVSTIKNSSTEKEIAEEEGILNLNLEEIIQDHQFLEPANQIDDHNELQNGNSETHKTLKFSDLCFSNYIFRSQAVGPKLEEYLTYYDAQNEITKLRDGNNGDFEFRTNICADGSSELDLRMVKEMEETLFKYHSLFNTTISYKNKALDPHPGEKIDDTKEEHVGTNETGFTDIESEINGNYSAENVPMKKIEGSEANDSEVLQIVETFLTCAKFTDVSNETNNLQSSQEDKEKDIQKRTNESNKLQKTDTSIGVNVASCESNGDDMKIIQELSCESKNYLRNKKTSQTKSYNFLKNRDSTSATSDEESSANEDFQHFDKTSMKHKNLNIRHKKYQNIRHKKYQNQSKKAPKDFTSNLFDIKLVGKHSSSGIHKKSHSTSRQIYNNTGVSASVAGPNRTYHNRSHQWEEPQSSPHFSYMQSLNGDDWRCWLQQYQEWWTRYVNQTCVKSSCCQYCCHFQHDQLMDKFSTYFFAYKRYIDVMLQWKRQWKVSQSPEACKCKCFIPTPKV